jgi:hypothetical protein
LDEPEADGIIFDPAEKQIPICKECCRKIARRYFEKWGIG